jgi:hypothetical protein
LTDIGKNLAHKDMIVPLNLLLPGRSRFTSAKLDSILAQAFPRRHSAPPDQPAAEVLHRWSDGQQRLCRSWHQRFWNFVNVE